jgi:hypothetical protein
MVRGITNKGAHTVSDYTVVGSIITATSEVLCWDHSNEDTIADNPIFLCEAEGFTCTVCNAPLDA